MTWTITDRAQRLGLILVVLVLIAAATPILLGSTSLVLMAVAAVSTVSAWRFSLARVVEVQIDADGITKTLGTRSWQLSWSQLTVVRFTRFLGSDQLLVAAEPLQHWSASDRLFQFAPAGFRAVQVPAGRVAEVKELLAAHGLTQG